MDKDLDNANPTILSAAQMPTRQSKREAPKSGPFHKFDDVIFAKPWYLSEPFCDEDSLWSEPEADHSQWTEEPIDEQEIYGEEPFLHTAPPLFFHAVVHLTKYWGLHVMSSNPAWSCSWSVSSTVLHSRASAT